MFSCPCPVCESCSCSTHKFYHVVVDNDYIWPPEVTRVIDANIADGNKTIIGDTPLNKGPLVVARHNTF